MPRFRELATQLALAGLLIFVANAPRLHAQVTTGTIVGTLSDANGVIPGASVVVREVNKNTSATVVTDAAGGYTAPFLDREITDNAFSGRVDHRMSGSDSFFVRFNYRKFKLDAPHGQANCCLPTPPEAAARFDLGPFVAGIQNTRLTTHGAAFNYSKVIRSTLVNELRVGYAKTEPYTTQSDYGHYSADSIGIAGINVTEIATGLPNINVTNFTEWEEMPCVLQQS